MPRGRKRAKDNSQTERVIIFQKWPLEGKKRTIKVLILDKMT